MIPSPLKRRLFADYLMAAKKGHPMAQFILAQCYQGGFGVERSVFLALDWYKNASTAGFSLASKHHKELKEQHILSIIDANERQTMIAKAEIPLPDFSKPPSIPDTDPPV